MQAQVVIATGQIIALGTFPAGSPDPSTVAVVSLTDAQATTAAQPGAKVLNANGSITVTPPPPPPLLYAGDLAMTGRLRTTDATQTEIYRATLRSMTGYRALATLLVVDAGNGDLRQIYASMVVKRLGAGAIVLPSVTLANHQDAGAAGWTAVPSASGNDFVITVTGAAGRTIDWLLDGRIVSFTPAGG